MQGHRTEYGDEQHVARRVCVAGEHASESHAWVSTFVRMAAGTSTPPPSSWDAVGHLHQEPSVAFSSQKSLTDMNGPAMRESEVLVLSELPC